MENLILKQNNELLLNPEVSKQIAEFEKQAKEIKEKQDKLRANILEAMKENGIKKLDTDEITITYYEESYSEKFDSKALKVADEETYNKYTKISKTKEYIKIQVK